MADDCRDVVRYWKLLNQGWDAVFGSRFVKGGGVIDYPWLKRILNRIANFLIRDRRLSPAVVATFQFDCRTATEDDCAGI